MGEAPNLGVVAKAFGDNISIAWLSAQLIDLSEFSGCKDKLDIFQLRSVAEVIMTMWAHLKVTELMLFFLRFKSGRYGKFYGAVDSMVITEALHEFARERYEAMSRYQQEDDARRKAAEEARNRAEVERFRNALSVSNMPVEEWYEIVIRHSLSVDEIAEIGWLFRIGYDKKAEA